MANIPSPPETAMYHSDALPSFYIAKVLHSRKMRTHSVGARFFVVAEAEKEDEPLRHKVILRKDRSGHILV